MLHLTSSAHKRTCGLRTCHKRLLLFSYLEYMSNPSPEDCGFGGYNVTEIGHIHIPVRDGCRLAARIYIPDTRREGIFTASAFSSFNGNPSLTELIRDKPVLGEELRGEGQEGASFPTILEYLPYYKDGHTATRDYARHNWFCSHGFVCVRLEIRGTGASEGRYYGEYLPREQHDCEDVIRYIQAQPWSNGKVGMYGKSWGGFDSLQMAFHQRSESRSTRDLVATAVSVCSTDDRYNDDIHYQNGVVIGSEMLPWAAQMFLWNARPPPPNYFTSYREWTSAWRNRLEATSQSWLAGWLEHQHEDDIYWKHGSIKYGYDKVDIPILVIGGLEDGYKSAKYRMFRKLNDACKFMIGTWGHQWPDDANLGPRLYFLELCRRWFTAHLTHDNNMTGNTSTWPRLQLFIRDSYTAQDLKNGDAPGKFVTIDKPKTEAERHPLTEPASSHPLTCDEDFGVFYLHNKKLQKMPAADVKEDKILLKARALQGYSPGAYMSMGRNTDFSYDQSPALAVSETWKSEELEQALYLVGDSTLFLGLSSETWERVYIHVKVCDVFPDNSATLISRCIYHLDNDRPYTALSRPPPSQRHPHDRLYALKMSLSAHRVLPGHRIAISIAPSGFPYMWPSCSRDKVYILPLHTYYVYETMSSNYAQQHEVQHPPPKPLLKIPSEVITEPQSEIRESCSNGIHKTELYDDGGEYYLPLTGIRLREITSYTYETDDDVTYGSFTVRSTLKMGFNKFTHLDHPVASPKDKDKEYIVQLDTVQEMSGSYETYDLDENVNITLNGEEFWSKGWKSKIPRHGL